MLSIQSSAFQFTGTPITLKIYAILWKPSISDVENCQETATYSTNLTYTEIRRILLSQLHERSIELSLRAAYTYRPVSLLVKNHQRKIDLLIIKKDKCF